MKRFCGVIHAECGKNSCQGCLIAEKWAEEKRDEWEASSGHCVTTFPASGEGKEESLIRSHA